MKTPRYTTPSLRTALSLAFLPLVCSSLPARAGTYTWTGAQDGSGDFNTPGSWSGSVVPGSTDTAVITGYSVTVSSTVGIGAADNLTLGTLDMNESNTPGVTSTVNQTGGTVTTGNFTSGNTGASKTFTYNISGGALNITNTLTFGAGSSGSGSGIVVNGGTANYTGGDNLILGDQSSGSLFNDYITVTAGVFNYTPSQSRWLVAGYYGTGTINVGGSGQFTYNGGSNGAFMLGFNTNSVGVMNVSGGVTSLTLNNGLYLGGYGGKATGTLNVSGGQVDIQNGGVHIGSGTSGTGSINITGGVVNLTTGDVTVGDAQNSTGSIAVTNGTFNYNGTANINFGVGTGATGILTVGTNGVFNATSAKNVFVGMGATAAMTLNDNGKVTLGGNIWMGNNDGSGSITLNGNSTFTAANSTVDVGHWAAYSNVGSTLSINDNASMTVGQLNVGGYESGWGSGTKTSAYGVVNLNGGTLTANKIALGQVNSPVNATHNVVNANGGTIKAASSQSAFFTSAGSVVTSLPYVNIQAGGLKFDTNGYNVGVNAYLNGDTTSTGGGFTKLGSGTLTLTGGGNYTGTTTVSAGELVISTSALTGNGNLSLADSTVLRIGGDSDSYLSQSFGTLSISGNVTLDFNSLGTSILDFADSSLLNWDGKLILTNFTVGDDALNFGGIGGLTSSQLADIVLAGYTDNGYTASLDSTGDVTFTAVPEPSSMAFMGIGLLVAAQRILRRRRS